MNRLETIKNIIELIRELYIDSDLAEKVASGIEEYLKSQAGSTRVAMVDSNDYIWEINNIINSITHDLHFHIEKHQQAYDTHQIVWRYTPHHIGLLKLDNINDENVRNEIIHIFGQLQDPVILDLRGCRGGSVETMLFLLSHFFDDGTPLIDVHTRLNPVMNLKAVSVIKCFERANIVKKYKGRLKVLIDSFTYSGGEIIAKTLQTHGRAKIYGTPTVGMTNMTNTRNFGELDLYLPHAKITDAFTKEDYDKKGVIPDFSPVTKEYIQTLFSELFVDTYSVYQ